MRRGPRITLPRRVRGERQAFRGVSPIRFFGLWTPAPRAEQTLEKQR
jgi:hypothetical protein